MKIQIDHIAKIEGHAGFIGQIVDGKIKDVKIETQEGARLFESLLCGRKYNEAPTITSRICGVCPVAHNLTSIKAIEAAFNISPTPQTIMLRQLMMAGQIIHSHILHLLFLAMSDYFQAPSSLEIAAKYPEETKKILKLRDYGNRIVEIIGGRTIHPLTSIVGGFTKAPERDALKNLLAEQQEMLKISLKFLSMVRKLSLPEFDHVSQYVALSSPDVYFSYFNKNKISSGETYETDKFFKMIEEKELLGNPSKRSTLNKSPYMVGALARMHINGNQLNPQAKEEASALEFHFPAFTPFHNNLAQAIEIVHLIEDVRILIEKLLELDITNVYTKYEPKAGAAVAALEVPRGTLYHYYDIDDKGIIHHVNIITPTAQFLNNLEEDIKYWLNAHKGEEIEEQKRRIAMITRAYDPCITCSIH